MSRKRRHLRKPKRDRTMEDIPMTPMIDVVFQLLIYFVFTFEIPDILSRMEVFRPAPDQTQREPDENVRRHTIGVYWDQATDRGFFTYNDQRVSAQALTTRMGMIANINPEQNIMVLATANSYHRDLVFVLNLLHDVGLKNVALLSSD